MQIGGTQCSRAAVEMQENHGGREIGVGEMKRGESEEVFKKEMTLEQSLAGGRERNDRQSHGDRKFGGGGGLEVRWK